MTYPNQPGAVRGSDTSQAAADSLPADLLRGLHLKIFNCISLCPLGATCDEIELLLGLRHQTASARVRELVLKNRIVDSGHRRLTRSGRRAAVYILAEQA